MPRKCAKWINNLIKFEGQLTNFIYLIDHGEIAISKYI